MPAPTRLTTRRLLLALMEAGMLLVFVCAALPASAQVSLAVSPIRVEHSVPVGEATTDVITIENMQIRPLRVRISVADWTLTRDGSPVFVKRGRQPERSMAEWIEVNPTECEVQPGARQVVRYTLSVPPGTPDGGYRAAIMVESLPDVTSGPRASQALLNARIAVILYQKVGVSKPQAEITEQQLVFDPAEPSRLAVKLTIRNSGAAHFRFQGESRILDPSGALLQSAAVPDAVVLPNSEREVLVPLKGPMPTSAFTILSRLDIGLKEWLEAETQVAKASPRH